MFLPPITSFDYLAKLMQPILLALTPSPRCDRPPLSILSVQSV
ncbi:hypothetical protein [Hydrococcus rivularis]|nr:hypothetical protein [Hydrococcus rivularis]